jgi:hypothetical protein
MSLFNGTKSTKPPENFTAPRIDFVGEQTGPVEDRLKVKFSEMFTQIPTVRSADLARLSYDESQGYSVGLCIRSTVGIDQSLQERLGKMFTEVFRPDQYLDILFIRDDQEHELRKVCRAFYESANILLTSAAPKIEI